MDIDWTSEAVIERALEFIKLMDIPCILFQTHNSRVISNEKSELFTKELHPNFCENSDHGNSIEEVINHLNHLDHHGIVIRSHKYNMPVEAQNIYANNGFKFSMNNYTDIVDEQAYKLSDGFYELNTFFEDGNYLKRNYPFKTNFLLDKMISDGIYVFNIHPIHLAFNSNEYILTRNFKDNMTKINYRNIDYDFIERCRFKGYGIKSFLTDFISINEVVL
jgi:hypothetical protein